MGVFGAYFGCIGVVGFNECCSGTSIGDGGFTLVCTSGRRGDGGFNGRCLGASIGDGGFMLVCISGCRGFIGFNVATSQLPVREKFALRTKNGPKLAVYGVLGEFFRENTAGGVAPGELCRGTAAERSVPGEFCRTTSQVRPLLGGRHLRSNREPTCWDHHERMGMKKHSRRIAW